MADIFPAAIIETAQVVIPATSSGTATTTTTGSVVSITLEPNTIATIFGVCLFFKNISITSLFEIHVVSQAIQDTAVNEQVIVAQLFGKGVSFEQNTTLNRPKDSPYHVVGDDKKHAIVWGPFVEKKKIQVALYWTNSKGNGLQPIDKGEIKEVRGSFRFYCQAIESDSIGCS